MNLDAHGAPSRCLLRLRENQGNPGLTDAAFLARFRERYPDWRERPGAADAARLIEIARDLGVASRGAIFTSYDQVLAEHRAGSGVLLTSAEPTVRNPPGTTDEFSLLLVAMDEARFTVWCPEPSGLSDTLAPASREEWERVQTRALVLYPFDVAP